MRLPRECNFPGEAVYIQKLGDSVILFPKDKVWETFLNGLYGFTDDFMADGREQPETQEREGKPIGPYDMLIAAQAVSKALILVTNNTDEFRRIPGLSLEDWR